MKKSTACCGLVWACALVLVACSGPAAPTHEDAGVQIDGTPMPGTDDGEACTGDAECASNHCQNGFCCGSGDCCAVAEDCPPSYSTAPVCNSQSDCQGTASVAQCQSSMCST